MGRDWIARTPESTIGQFSTREDAQKWADRWNEGGNMPPAVVERTRETRPVIHNLPELQALPPGTKLRVQGDRAAQVDKAEAWDEGTGEEIPATRLLYVGTDLYDNLTPAPTKEERDTLRRMLPAVVIDPAS